LNSHTIEQKSSDPLTGREMNIENCQKQASKMPNNIKV